MLTVSIWWGWNRAVPVEWEDEEDSGSSEVKTEQMGDTNVLLQRNLVGLSCSPILRHSPTLLDTIWNSAQSYTGTLSLDTMQYLYLPEVEACPAASVIGKLFKS